MTPDQTADLAPDLAHARRVRRKPAEGEREILDAVDRLLQTTDFRDLTVDDIMSRTSMRRSAFYTYFQDRNAVVLRLIDDVEAEMMQASQPWLDGEGDGRATLRDGLDQVVHVYTRHGHVMRAIHEASYHDHGVEAEYRGRIIDGFVAVVAARLREIGHERKTPFPSPRDVAHALVTMNVNVMADRLGRSPADRPRQVARTLHLVWDQVIYGQAEDLGRPSGDGRS